MNTEMYPLAYARFWFVAQYTVEKMHHEIHFIEKKKISVRAQSHVSSIISEKSLLLYMSAETLCLPSAATEFYFYVL